MSTPSSSEIRSQSVSIPAANADLETAWRFLEEGMDHIMSSSQISYLRFQELYTVAYNCMTVSRSRMPTESQEVTNAQKSASGLALYNKLKAYLVRYLEGLREGVEDYNTSGVGLLQRYAKEWDKYMIGVDYLNRIFAHLNRHWVAQERNKGCKDVYPVTKLALVEWREQFLYSIQGEDMKLTCAVLEAIEKQRRGETIDQEFIQKVTDSFVKLGIDEENINKESMEVYKELFENLYVEATVKYISVTLEACLAEEGASAFLEEMQKIIVAEEERAHLYVRTFDPQESIRNCVKVILEDENIWIGFQRFLDDAEEEDLQRTNALVQSLPEVLEPVRQKINEFNDKKAASEV